MAEPWRGNPDWTPLLEINKGLRVDLGDGFRASDQNKIVENLQYLFNHAATQHVYVGNVTTITTAPGTQAYVAITGRYEDQIGTTEPEVYLDFEFRIPQGATGATGPQGTPAGVGTPVVQPTTTVDYGAGSNVTVSTSGPDTAKVFNFKFTLERGPVGPIGPEGPAGPPAGMVVLRVFSNSWTNSDNFARGRYMRVITTAEHGFGTNSNLFVWTIPTIDGEANVTYDSPKMDPGGSITIYSDVTWDGKVFVTGGMVQVEGIPEAPTDGKIYGRKDADWAEVSGGGGGATPTQATFTIAASNSLNKGVADFICDGVDDQLEIQEAIDSLPTHGGKIFLLAGNYNITQALLINRDNVTLAGEGSSTVLVGDIVWENYRADLMIITGNFCTFESLYFNSIDPLARDAHIRIGNGQQITIRHCIITIACRIFVENAATIQQIFIHDNYFYGQNFTGGSGVDNVFISLGSTVKHVYITSNVVYSTGRYTGFVEMSNAERFVMITDNYMRIAFNTLNHGVIVLGAGTSHVKISGNYVAGTQASGSQTWIRMFNGCSHIQVTNNRLYGYLYLITQYFPGVARASCNYITIINNEGGDQLNTNCIANLGGYGISILNNTGLGWITLTHVERGTISGNRLNGQINFQSTSGSGAQYQNTDLKKLIISNNVCSHLTNSSQSFWECTITGNNFFSVSSWTFNSSRNTIANNVFHNAQIYGYGNVISGNIAVTISIYNGANNLLTGNKTEHPITDSAVDTILTDNIVVTPL